MLTRPILPGRVSMAPGALARFAMPAPWGLGMPPVV